MYTMIPFVNYAHTHEGQAHLGDEFGCMDAHSQGHIPGKGL